MCLLQSLGSVVDAKYSADPAVCLALNRNYKRFITEHVKNISLVLEHNRQRQVCGINLTSLYPVCWKYYHVIQLLLEKLPCLPAAVSRYQLPPLFSVFCIVTQCHFCLPVVFQIFVPSALLMSLVQSVHLCNGIFYHLTATDSLCDQVVSHTQHLNQVE